MDTKLLKTGTLIKHKVELGLFRKGTSERKYIESEIISIFLSSKQYENRIYFSIFCKNAIYGHWEYEEMFPSLFEII